MRYNPYQSRHCRYRPPPLSRHTRAPRVDSLLGGGAPTIAATAGVVLRAGVPLEGAPTTIEDRPNCAATIGLLWFVFITEGEQNRVP
jgi:hypothetical protein